MTDLNVPQVRQDLLARRLSQGQSLSLPALMAEFDVSVDTLRRDLAALERGGQARRVRGGAIPATPARPLRDRDPSGLPPGLVARAVHELRDARTILLDGGTSVLALARALPDRPDRLIVTPSPNVAAAAHGNGLATIALGGPISVRGGIATGAGAEAALAEISADVAVLGACGIDAEFGLSADELPEARVKRALAQAARRTLVLTGGAKVGCRARHRVLPPEAIDALLTDAASEATAPFAATEIVVIRA